MELDLKALLERYSAVTEALKDEKLTDEKRKQLLAELRLYSDILTEYNKSVTEDRKVDAEILKIEQEAQTKKADRTFGFLGDLWKGLCNVGAAALAAGASVVTIGRILHAEGADRLVISKALQFVLKPKI